MSSQFQSHSPPPAPRRTALGEVLRGFVQLAMLAFVAILLLVAFVIVMFESRRFFQAEMVNAQLAQDDERSVNRELASALRRQRELQSQAAALEARFEAIAPKLGKTPSEQTAAAGDKSAPAAADPLLLRLLELSQPVQPADMQMLHQLAADDPRRPLISAALRKRVETAAAPREFVSVAMAWDDAAMGGAIVTAYEAHPEKLAGEVDFYPLRSLGARWGDPRTPALVLRCVTPTMTRAGDIPETARMHRHGETFAVLAAIDPELLARHAGENTAAGDVVRGALFRLSRWPEAVVAALEKAFAEADETFSSALTQWVTDMPPPDNVRNRLFAVAARQIPRTGTGDPKQDLQATALLPELATADTIDALVRAAVRLEEQNPAAARAMVLRTMKSHPRETLLVLAESAAEGKTLPPPQITDPWWAPLKQEAEQARRLFLPPVLSNPRWAADIDGALAIVLLDGATAAKAAAIAGDWGGPLSAAVLEKAAANAPAAQAETFRAAISKMRRRTEEASK